MTTTLPEDTPQSAPAELRLGRDAVLRMRLPGPPVGRPLPSRIGSLASSISRFAAATSRPVDVRRALAGPDPRGLGASSAPPRWWTPTRRGSTGVDGSDGSVGSVESGAAPVPGAVPAAWLAPARPVALRRLPERGLPRAARAVQDESTYTPGGILGNLRGEAIRVRRIEEVAAVGPMLMTSDRAKLNAGIAAARRQSAPPPAAATPAPTVRRSTTRAPRQPATPAAPGPASEPSSADPAPPAPAVSTPAVSAPAVSVPAVSAPAALAGTPPRPAPPSGAPATVSSTPSVADSPPLGPTPPPAPTSGAPATLPDTRSVADSPPPGPTPPPAPPSGAPATVPDTRSVADSPPPGPTPPPAPTSGAPAPLSETRSVADSPLPGAPAPPLRRVSRPAWQLRSTRSRFDGLVRRTPARAGAVPATVAAGLASADRGSLTSGLRDTAVVPAAGPRLIAGGTEAPAAVRRRAWSAGSIVMRQAADTRVRAAAPGSPALATSLATSLVTSLAPTPAAPTVAVPAATPATAPGTDGTSAPAPADPVLRRLPTAARASAHAAPATDPATDPATEPDLRRLPRLWRRSTEIRPAADVRASTPAPVLGLARTSAPTAPHVPTAPGARLSPGALAPVSAALPATAASPAPPTRIGAHVAAPGVARAEVAMPELMAVRRATAHGTDRTRALATGFGAPAPIRPASAAATALTGTPAGPVQHRSPAAPAAPGSPGPAVARTGGGFGETRLWRRPARAGAATRPGGPSGTWSAAATSPQTPASPQTPTSPQTSATPGHRPAPDARRLTVAPPRIAVAPQPQPAPPVPDVARDLARPDRAPSTGTGTGTGAGAGRSLVEATAHLFSTSQPGTPPRPVVRRSLEGDTAMAIPPPPPALSSLPVPAPFPDLVREPGLHDPDLGDVAGPYDQVLPGVGLDQVVDAVVERIERRVVDELERRGRWQGWGVR